MACKLAVIGVDSLTCEVINFLKDIGFAGVKDVYQFYWEKRKNGQ